MLAGVLREITASQLGIRKQNFLDCLQPKQLGTLMILFLLTSSQNILMVVYYSYCQSMKPLIFTYFIDLLFAKQFLSSASIDIIITLLHDVALAPIWSISLKCS